MSITQQYLLDTYRARQHGDPTAPALGAHDWQVMRELPDHRRFRTVLTGRPVRERARPGPRVRVRTVWARLSARPVISGECAPRTP
ncbi:hypothetical protein ACPYPG_20520 [Streptomyces sp. FR-108]|uniref:hypothetical protein n=1 Tax=Streptomyces sp. FR-108 TaxID=3416665 RepID=UPI003CEB833E